MIRTTLTAPSSPTETMDTKLEVMETGTFGMKRFLLSKSESNENLSHNTDSTDPTHVEYSSHSSEGEVWTGDDDQTLNSLLEDDEDQTLNSLLEDDEDSLLAEQEDSIPGRLALRTRLDKQVPSEIVVIQESPLTSFKARGIDELSQLQEAELLVQCYKEKVQSTERSGDLLHKYLQKTQLHAQELANENHGLKYAIAEMSREEVMRKDQDLLFKTVIGACFVFYMFGCSEYYLAAPVGLYLFFGVVSFFL